MPELKWRTFWILLLIGFILLTLASSLAKNHYEIDRLAIEERKKAVDIKTVEDVSGGSVAGFDDLRQYDGFAVSVWYPEKSVIRVGDAYLRLEPDVYSALRFVCVSRARIVDSVAVYERVARIRETREKFSK